ncbi:outer membrane protein transport protein [Algoriphagus lutimaris]|uniref:OmpP1/FadL family transporter n=1 Tax=Algoriphagus lutimaris TaxID=613197 RepID=UPI00196BA01F|nr:outer membrane protein transport protein [Algoriphagus lutimaris]MBN3519975.1 outer membrane protein transport protein [Algoriphagus lutimaris]
MRLTPFIFFVVLFTSNLAFGQSGYYEDAYRFSHVKPAGSSRVMAIGGTQWSLGGDVSNIAGNPAGLGFFRTSEASISLGYSDWKVNTNYLDQQKSYNTTNFNLPNLSYVMANPKEGLGRGAFKGGAFGISIQRIANFNTEYGFFSDQLGNTSIIDFYLQDANGIRESQIESYGLTGLAYSTYQINPIFFDEDGNVINDPSTYDSFVTGFPFQDENIRQEGSSNQITFSYGANFNHKVFVGGSLGIRNLNFSSTKTYNEEFPDGPLINSSLTERLYINGSGINLNLGLIYKPIDYLNLGFTFQTPTWYALNEEYEASMYANYDNYEYEPEDIVLGEVDALSDYILGSYNLNTPLKIGAGATFFLGKNGFISGDVDFVDYSNSTIKSRDFDEGPDNQVIRTRYTSTLNYRLGAEVRLDVLRLRGGYAYYGDPISNSDYDRSTNQISGGIGAKFNKFTIDMALISQKANGLYSSYQVLDGQNNNIGPVTELENRIFTGMLTLGFSF